jgi:hypothetical protein
MHHHNTWTPPMWRGGPYKTSLRFLEEVLLCKIVQVNFHEKALFVKADVAAPDRGRAQRLALYPSRYASIRTPGEPALWWLGALCDPSFRATEEALQSSHRSLLLVRMDQVHMAQSPSTRSEAMGHEKPRRPATLRSTPRWAATPFLWLHGRLLLLSRLASGEAGVA